MDFEKTMTIVNEDGSTESVEVILPFEFDDTKQKYVVYTKNEADDKGNITIYVASVKTDTDGKDYLDGILTDEEWARIKNVLREISKGEQ